MILTFDLDVYSVNGRTFVSAQQLLVSCCTVKKG